VVVPVIGYVVSDNTGVRMDKPGVILRWEGDVTRPGFYYRNDKDLIYVDKKTGKVLIATNLDLSLEREYSSYYYRTLFNQPDNDWHTDPDTGDRIRYRYLEPVEWVFG
jgi:hypothetical protein